ncbi:deoxyribose-phosphate aldolase [[Mycoplasma] mobile]|uniref:Deoxyribose-phosphate aldolase n=1 Tax=Mycoplasma mobile (strain ATCC 43663 / 163K / NCTC 11711) TaxID=267748 RepID=DEOC_MYCM1|nr:deoxyribose-phosphate aldolase [[Mycoplasma] mobile]Q6KHA7.1 RecName: Full=Deoxyribose-phosphate aldolase; Short=DERA; AltName: Full=2-deoxy-D-ribose 5-phosphate aldolase; AltName: Full=Phosphodeoxyriboaldolase; Short=Deoxyriboaldolase [Mycoplasma mobile 163K]AAT28023.1 deoxyribose-phosphate aldolase [Mycoplasma mobile 163K]
MKFNNMIDHTLLKAEATTKDVDKLIAEAKEYGFKSVCVNSSWVKYVKEKLKGSDVLVCAVVGFPLGAMSMQAKVFEAKLAIDHGADEIDMVINIGRFRDDQHDYVLNEIKKIKEVMGNKVLKVIIETALLDKKGIKDATNIVLQSGAEFIKTSTGFSYSGAQVEDIEVFKEILGDKVAIKASGGIKNLNDMKNLYKAGARRFGTSAAVAIVKEQGKQ